jgi:hypothetical protein
VFILKGVKVLCFDTLLQVFILKVLIELGFTTLCCLIAADARFRSGDPTPGVLQKEAGFA